MNANEVIANLALQALGHGKGRYDLLHPNDHVNASQSTNDVYPTAIRLAVLDQLDGLAEAVEELSGAFAERAARFAGISKTGRTQLQDAVPMTVGQEFAAWSATVAEEVSRLAALRPLLMEINLGATAIGTGITAPPGFADTVCRHLREITVLPLVTAPDLVEATSDAGVFITVSGTLKRTAVKVSKICNDLRLLASGPQAGFGELRLPPRQAGSSIMPGKVNPVIPEMVNQVAFAAVGVDATVTFAAEGGQLQLNPFEPVIAHHLLQVISWMTAAFERLGRLCVTGIEVHADRLAAVSASSVGLATALTPALGYAAAAEIAKAALAGQGTVRDLALASGALSPAELDTLLAADRLAGPSPLEG
jgi:aspartate ammonia-lyase